MARGKLIKSAVDALGNKIGVLEDFIRDHVMIGTPDVTFYRGSRDIEKEIKPFTDVTHDKETAIKYSTLGQGKDEHSNLIKMKLKIRDEEVFNILNENHFNLAKRNGLLDDLDNLEEANDLVNMNLPEGHPLEMESDFELLESIENDLKKLGFKGHHNLNESGIRVYDPSSIEVISQSRIK